MTKDIRKYDFIDALRGYAILGVVAVHSSSFIAPDNAYLQLLMSSGWLGVQLFYIASALTLCMSWEARRFDEIAPVRNFYIRRFFRIAPMFYIAIAYYMYHHGLASSGNTSSGIEWWIIALTASFLHGFNPQAINAVVPGGWSVAVEMNFYLLLPFVLMHFNSVRSLILFFLISLGLYALSKPIIWWLFEAHYSSVQQNLVSDFYYMNFFGQLPVFAIGLLTYAAFHNVKNMRRFIFFGVPVLIGFILVVKLLHIAWLAVIFPNYIIMAFCFAFFALALSYYQSAILVNKVVIFLGKVSFSLYLTHYAVLMLFAKLGSKTVFKTGDVSSIMHFLCVVLVASSVSYLFYITIERQGIVMGKRLIDRLEKNSPALPAN